MKGRVAMRWRVALLFSPSVRWAKGWLAGVAVAALIRIRHPRGCCNLQTPRRLHGAQRGTHQSSMNPMCRFAPINHALICAVFLSKLRLRTCLRSPAVPSGLSREGYGGQLHRSSSGTAWRWRTMIVTSTSTTGPPPSSAQLGLIPSQCWSLADVPRLASRLPRQIGQSASGICDLPIRKIAGRLTRSAAHSVF